MDALKVIIPAMGLRTALLTIGICSLTAEFAVAQTTIVPNGAATVTTPYPGNIGTPAGQPASAAALPATLPQAPVAAAVALPSQIQPSAPVARPGTTGQITAVPPSLPGQAVPAATQSAPQIPGSDAAASAPANASAMAPAALPANESNPFSSVRESNDATALKAQLPTIEQRLRQVESRVSAIQQVQVALPADALNQGGGGRISGSGAAATDDESVEMQTATFIACVNGRAMFRDSDQKPFFVDAKEATQNDTVRRIGGCKH